MYTGLVIEELLTMVERAEERASRSRRSLDYPADPKLLRQPGWKFPQETTMLLAGVA